MLALGGLERAHDQHVHRVRRTGQKFDGQPVADVDLQPGQRVGVQYRLDRRGARIGPAAVGKFSMSIDVPDAAESKPNLTRRGDRPRGGRHLADDLVVPPGDLAQVAIDLGPGVVERGGSPEVVLGGRLGVDGPAEGLFSHGRGEHTRDDQQCGGDECRQHRSPEKAEATRREAERQPQPPQRPPQSIIHWLRTIAQPRADGTSTLTA